MGISLNGRRNMWPIPRSADHGMRYMADVVNGAEGFVWDLSPDYQRDHVWTTKQREAFLGYALEGGPLTPIWVNRFEMGFDRPEVIDGKQRLTSILMFVGGTCAAILHDGDRVKYEDLDATDRRFLPRIPINYVDLSRSERLSLYLRLNAGGTLHTEAEISRVREMLSEIGG